MVLQGVMAVHGERRAMVEMEGREPEEEELQDAQFVLKELDHRSVCLAQLKS